MWATSANHKYFPETDLKVYLEDTELNTLTNLVEEGAIYRLKQ